VPARYNLRNRRSLSKDDDDDEEEPEEEEEEEDDDVEDRPYKKIRYSATGVVRGTWASLPLQALHTHECVGTNRRKPRRRSISSQPAARASDRDE